MLNELEIKIFEKMPLCFPASYENIKLLFLCLNVAMSCTLRIHCETNNLKGHKRGLKSLLRGSKIQFNKEKEQDNSRTY